LDPETLELKWSEPNEEELVKFMVTDNGFNEERIRNGVRKLDKARGTTTQGRLDTFFKVVSTSSTTTKRKETEDKGSQKKKAKTAGGFKRPK